MQANERIEYYVFLPSPLPSQFHHSNPVLSKFLHSFLSLSRKRWQEKLAVFYLRTFKKRPLLNFLDEKNEKNKRINLKQRYSIPL